LRKFKNLRNLTAENHCHLNRVETHLIWKEFPKEKVCNGEIS
jgi:hypothetical protein